jgi:stage II sporulation protein D
VAVAVALAASCRTTALALRSPQAAVQIPAPPPPEPLPNYESLVAPPSIRVGILVDGPRASLAADSGVIVMDVSKGQAWTGRKATVQRATFVPASASEAGPRFMVQVARLTHGDAARDLAARAQTASGLPPSVRYNPEDATYEVRVGEFPTREAAEALAKSLGVAGLGSPFVVSEAGPEPGARLRLLETGEEFRGATVIPAKAGESLTYDGAAYRGYFEVRGGEGESLTVVNTLNLEDYLKGVVPNELSPQGFPEIEALKAQAVAARTYALRHKGQFEAKGYDLCATPSCQVYRGRSSEDTLSSKAVDDTRGIAAYYQGMPINAYYTSTCGGHTEDAVNIFDSDEPYLKGVACLPERSAWATIRSAPGSSAPESRDVSFLKSLSVLDQGAQVSGTASGREMHEWIVRLAATLHRTGCAAPGGAALKNRGDFYRSLVATLCWTDRGTRLLGAGDPDYLLQVEDRASLNESERLASAVLLSEGILAPLPDNTLRVKEAPSRAEALHVLARAALKAGGPSLVSGEFRGLDEGGALKVKSGDDVEGEPLRPDVKVYHAVSGESLPTSEVTLPVGENVSLVLKEGGVAFLEAQANPLGVAADRSSRYFRWELRLSPAQIQAGISRYGSVGRVKDLDIRRRGTSGRVVELAVEGAGGEMVLKGLKIRNAFGLRENLFVLERERDPAGGVERFVFVGKGWGHGVGLCQVGSYGMALAGANYDEILRHYYQGITLQKAY